MSFLSCKTCVLKLVILVLTTLKQNKRKLLLHITPKKEVYFTVNGP